MVKIMIYNKFIIKVSIEDSSDEEDISFLRSNAKVIIYITIHSYDLQHNKIFRL